MTVESKRGAGIRWLPTLGLLAVAGAAVLLDLGAHRPPALPLSATVLVAALLLIVALHRRRRRSTAHPAPYCAAVADAAPRSAAARPQAPWR